MELSFELYNLWIDDDLTVGLFGVFVEIILMLLLGWIELFERFYLSSDLFAP